MDMEQILSKISKFEIFSLFYEYLFYRFVFFFWKDTYI